MLVIPGAAAANDCDRVTRRDLLRVGGSGVLGLSLADSSRFRKRPPPQTRRRTPRTRAGPASARPRASSSSTCRAVQPSRPLGPEGQRAGQGQECLQAHHTTSRHAGHGTLPKIAKVIDKMTLIRTMSYTPIGLFNHTAAIYQMHTGYTTDKVSALRAAGAAEPEGLPDARLEHHQVQAADRADAAVRDDAAAAAGVERRRQGRHGRLPRQGVRPVPPLPGRRRHGHGQDGPHPDG